MLDLGSKKISSLSTLMSLVSLKSTLAIQAARKFRLMPYNDCRAPNPEARMVGARDGEFVIFRDSLKAGFW